jgi:hypothetical protein
MIVPGRILVIDDVPDQVEKVVESLRQEGESVIFTTSVPDDKHLENVRLLIIDLYLVPDDKDASYDIVTGILEKISQKTRFFIIAIWTKYARNTAEDQRIIKDLENLYKERTNADLKAIFLEPFGKTIEQLELWERIKKSMTSHPECGLLFEIEKTVENARDHAVSDLIVTASVPVILNALKEEIGDVALSRQMIDLFLKVLSRYCKPTEMMSDCVKTLITQSPSIDVDKYGFIHSLESYYDVPREEIIWTGDVLEKKDGKEEYAVIVSPACDFAQRKKRPLDFIKIISAIRINQSDFVYPERLREIKTKLKIETKLNEVPKAILTGASLQRRFYVLKYLKDTQADILFHLVLDFQRVTNLTSKETAAELEEEGWRRVCRIDTPIIDNLLQDYSTYSSRIGIKAIPKDIVKGTVDKIRS